jgi:hypothetical protein
VLDSEKYARTQELAETARDFCDKVAQLSDTVATVVDAVDRQVRLASSAGVAETNETPRRFFFSPFFRVGGTGDPSGASSPPSPRDGAACSDVASRVAY